jgi:hypothetical protein
MALQEHVGYVQQAQQSTGTQGSAALTVLMWDRHEQQ